MRSRSIVMLVSHSAAGGAQELWIDLAAGLAERGHRVALWALYPWPGSRCEARDGFEWQYVVSCRPTGVVGVATLVRGLIAKIRAEQPDVVLSALPAANVLAAIASKAVGGRSRVVTTHHSPSSTYSRPLAIADGQSGTLSSVAAIVCVSDSVRAGLAQKRTAYRAKLHTIKNAIPPRTEKVIERLLQARRRSRPGRVVVAAGRLAEQKNYPLLIHAAALAPTLTIELIGDGPLRDELVSLAGRLDVANRIRFHGHLSREDTLARVAAADVFAQVSLFEGHSLALLEAAKLGLPLIVSAAPVQIEGITARDGTRCGIVVPLDDPAALAEAMTRLLDNRAEREHYAVLARRLGEEATFGDMVSAYEKLIG